MNPETIIKPDYKKLCNQELADLCDADARNELCLRVMNAMDHYRHLNMEQLHALLYALTTPVSISDVNLRAIRDLIRTKASSPNPKTA